jgi:hypothetical protein
MLLIGNIITDKLKKYEDIDVNAAVTLMDEKDLIIIDKLFDKMGKYQNNKLRYFSLGSPKI